MKDGGAAQFRRGIGADILEAMEKNSDLPLPNVQRLSKVMTEYFHKEGYIDDVKERGYKWRPDADYWQRNIGVIAEYMRKERNKYFIFLREQGGARYAAPGLRAGGVRRGDLRHQPRHPQEP